MKPTPATILLIRALGWLSRAVYWQRVRRIDDNTKENRRHCSFVSALAKINFAAWRAATFQ